MSAMTKGDAPVLLCQPAPLVMAMPDAQCLLPPRRGYHPPSYGNPHPPIVSLDLVSVSLCHLKGAAKRAAPAVLVPAFCYFFNYFAGIIP